jgi:hypothetical protein
MTEFTREPKPIEPIPVAVSVPAAAKANDDKLVYVEGLHARLLAEWARECPDPKNAAEYTGYFRDFDARMHKVGAALSKLRPVVWPDAFDGSLAGTDRLSAHKLNARESKMLSPSDYTGHPELTVTKRLVEPLDPNEDFTTYSETDPNSDLTVASNQVTVSTMRRDSGAHLTRDEGAGNIGNQEWFWHWNWTAADDQAFACITGAANSATTIFDAGQNISGAFWRRNVGSYLIYGAHIEAGGFAAYDIYMTNSGALKNWYPKLTRSGSSCVLYCYDDSGRTNLVDTLTWDDDGDARRYTVAVASRGGTGTDTISGVLTDFDIGRVAAGVPRGLDAGAFGLGRGGRGLSPIGAGL